MTILRTLCTRFAGLMVAAVALVLVLAPVADAASCAAEGVRPAAGQASHQRAVAEVATADEATSDAGGKAIDLGEQGGCQHGHCHHGGSPSAAASEAAVVTFLRTDTPRPMQADQHPSRLASRLDRPPRA